MKRILTALIAIGFAPTLFAQPGITKYDIVPGLGNSYPQHLTPFGNKLCFYANDGVKGWELWKVTAPAAAAMVADIGPVNAIPPATYAHPACELNGKFYFSANNGIAGQEVYVYDGSATPTLAADVEPNAGSSYPDNFVADNGALYFKASTAANGSELWSYTPGLPLLRRLTDINAGIDSSVTGNVVAFNGNIYFTAYTAANGNELYQYNVILDNTLPVADINSGPGSSDPKSLVVVNGKLYFSAYEPGYGRELYAYDGVNAPTRLTDVSPLFLDGLPNYNFPVIAGLNNKVYFSATNQTEYHIYVYDPGTGNTALIGRINTIGSSEPSWFCNYGGKIFLTAQDSTNRFEIYAFDGFSALRISNLCASGIGSQPSELTPIGNDLYFKANECNGTGIDLFSYNPANINVENVPAAIGVQVYPNPVTDELYIQASTKNATLYISDMMGRKIYQNSTFSNKQIINTAQWAPGNYLLHLIDASGTTTTKPVVKE